MPTITKPLHNFVIKFEQSDCVELVIHEDKITIKFFESCFKEIEYRKSNGGCAITYKELTQKWRRCPETLKEVKKFLPKENFIRRAVLDFVELFGGPNAKILQWDITPAKEGYIPIQAATMFSCFRKILGSQNHKLHLESLDIKMKVNQEQVMSILPFVKEKVLSNIHVRKTKTSHFWNKVTATEQWKNATYIVFGKSKIPVDKFFHVRSAEFEMEIMTIEDVDKIIEVGTRPESKDFFFFVKCWNLSNEVEDHLDNLRDAPPPGGSPEEKYIKVTDMDNVYLSVKRDLQKITFSRDDDAPIEDDDDDSDVEDEDNS